MTKKEMMYLLRRAWWVIRHETKRGNCGLVKEIEAASRGKRRRP